MSAEEKEAITEVVGTTMGYSGYKLEQLVHGERMS